LQVFVLNLIDADISNSLLNRFIFDFRNLAWGFIKIVLRRIFVLWGFEMYVLWKKWLNDGGLRFGSAYEVCVRFLVLVLRESLVYRIFYRALRNLRGCIVRNDNFGHFLEILTARTGRWYLIHLTNRWLSFLFTALHFIR
jgi:hypothetical protein